MHLVVKVLVMLGLTTNVLASTYDLKNISTDTPIVEIGGEWQFYRNTFLSENENGDTAKNLRGFSLAAKRIASCTDCKNFISQSDSDLRCRIFSVEYEKFGVPHLENVSVNHARYCDYFDANANAGMV